MKPGDLIVIGGGAGGLVAASVAGQLGLKVTLIEKTDRLGGDCLHHGCVPSKALLHVARVAHTLRRADRAGLTAVEPEVSLAKVNACVRSAMETIQEHDDPDRFRNYGCEVIFGAARFLDPHTVEVEGRRLSGRRFVIATGSGPVVPPIPGLAEAGHVTHREIFSLPELPPRLLVLGGGPVGVEMGQAFARLGSRVTLLQRNRHLLPREDPELSEALRVCLEAEGLEVHTGVDVERVGRDGAGITVEAADGRYWEGDQLLVATGRRPQVEGLDLDAAGVEHGPRGIVVDRRQRTSRKHIYACGDVCGPHAFTHMAEYQAGIVIANALFRIPRRADYRIVPRVIYTDPELASVGMSEAEARERHGDVRILRFPFAQVDRSIVEGETAGQIKLVVRRGRLLGAALLGAQAGELLHELVLAMRVGARIGDIAAAIHAYPTRSQIHRRAANTAYADKLFSPATRRLVRWLNRLPP